MKYRATPVNVPPVPAPITTASTLPLQLIVELAASGLVVEVRIRLVFELSSNPRVRSLRGARLHQLDRAHHSFGIGRTNDLSAQRLHKLDFLYGKSLGDRQHNLVAAIAADERQPDAGVAGRGFKNRGAWSQATFLFGALNHSESSAVLDAAARVEVFELGVDVSGIWREQFCEGGERASHQPVR